MTAETQKIINAIGQALIDRSPNATDDIPR